MTGVLVNSVGILVGTLFGLLFKKALSGKRRTVVMQALGVCILFIGMKDALLVENVLFLIVSLVVGGFLGALLKIEDSIERFGSFVGRKIAPPKNIAEADGSSPSTVESSNVAKGFVTATLIFCVGAMAIYGSIQAGLGDNTTLYTKTILDMVTAAALAATLGWGVSLSIIPLFIFQGGISLLASFIQPIATTAFLNQLSAIGGILVITIGINLLEIKKIHTADLLPAIFGAFAVFLL